MITRDNYEEWFLLYVDDELTADQKKAVDDFVMRHPDLKEELDLLCSTRLPLEDVCFTNKEDLLAGNMKVNTVDESLLLYIDNELPDAAKSNVEKQLKTDVAFALQYQLLLKTKLDKTEHIPYPNKKELYHHTERRIAPVWMRIAAAVLLITGGTALWMNMGTSKSSDANVAIVTPQHHTQQPAAGSKQVEAPAVNNPGNTVAATTEKPVAETNTLLAANTPAPVKHAAKKTRNQTFSNPHTDETTAVAANKTDNLPVVEKENTIALQPQVIKKADKPAFNNLAVTSDAAPAYISTDAAAKTTVPVNAVTFENEGGKSGGSVKGFLRKATRFIERRTGIKTVDENDQLLVGAVALQL